MYNSAHEFFRWHPLCRLRNVQSNAGVVKHTQPLALNGTSYISDADTTSALEALQLAIRNHHGFCVHSLQYQPPPEQHIVQPQDSPYFLALSSGSNGQPKRIRRTHSSWIASFEVNSHMAQITAQDSYAIVGRTSHSLALYAALEAAHIGADIHMLTELRPDRQLSSIAELQSSILYATPTQLRMLCLKADTSTINNLAVRQIFCGGGKLDQGTLKLVGDVFVNANVQEFYGSTETSFISISDNSTPIGSVGKPYPSVKLLIKPIDGDADLNSGEIWVKSPYLFHSYSDKGKQAALWHNGYVSVGEVGHLDDDGYLFLAGRQSRRVNIADTLVYPEEIESILYEHTAINLCAVVPVADAKRGNILVAVVEADASDALQQELLIYLRQRVGALKAPRRLIFVPRMPLLASGKPDLTTIEQQLA